MKYIYAISILIITVILLNTCGIEDTTMFFQEPKNLSYDDATFTIEFDGYNQEEDDDKYLFVGYDVYYYFSGSKSSNAKKAAVRIPVQSHADVGLHSDLLDFTDSDNESSFENYSDNDKDTIYQEVTFPVTWEMIDDVLDEGKSDNVQLCFANTELIQPSDENPHKISNDSILMEELFPKYEEYKSQIEGGPWDENNFEGFLDQDYYSYYGISLYKFEGGFNYYKMKVFVIAKGFNSNTERNKGDYIESLKSSVKEITIQVVP
jgi:hypothetical protein